MHTRTGFSFGRSIQGCCALLLMISVGAGCDKNQTNGDDDAKRREEFLRKRIGPPGPKKMPTREAMLKTLRGNADFMMRLKKVGGAQQKRRLKKIRQLLADRLDTFAAFADTERLRKQILTHMQAYPKLAQRAAAGRLKEVLDGLRAHYPFSSSTVLLVGKKLDQRKRRGSFIPPVGSQPSATKMSARINRTHALYQLRKAASEVSSLFASIRNVFAFAKLAEGRLVLYQTLAKGGSTLSDPEAMWSFWFGMRLRSQVELDKNTQRLMKTIFATLKEPPKPVAPKIVKRPPPKPHSKLSPEKVLRSIFNEDLTTLLKQTEGAYGAVVKAGLPKGSVANLVRRQLPETMKSLRDTITRFRGKIDAATLLIARLQYVSAYTLSLYAHDLRNTEFGKPAAAKTKAAKTKAAKTMVGMSKPAPPADQVRVAYERFLVLVRQLEKRIGRVFLAYGHSFSLGQREGNVKQLAQTYRMCNRFHRAALTPVVRELYRLEPTPALKAAIETRFAPLGVPF